MSSLALSLSNNARGFLDGLQPKQFKQVANRIFALARDPYPADCKHLSGHSGHLTMGSASSRERSSHGKDQAPLHAGVPR